MNTLHDKVIKYILSKNTATRKYIKTPSLSLYNKIIQIGGKNVFKIEYLNKTYNFIEDEFDKNIYVLHAIDSNEACVMIEVNRESKIATIQNIDSLAKKCLLQKDKVGSTLLKITLKLLTKLTHKMSKKFNVEVITLSDDSYKICPANKRTLDMKIMEVLRTGETWYGRYGFRPCNKILDNNIQQSCELDEYDNNLYEFNKTKMEILNVSDAKLLDFFKDASIKNEKMKTVLELIEKIIIKHPEMLVTEFINRFLKEFDKTCNLFYDFYKSLYDYIGLKTLHNTYYGIFINDNIIQKYQKE